jgi:hypothetical protein
MVDIDCVVQKKIDGSWKTLALDPDRHPLPPLYSNRAMFDLLAGAGLRIGAPASPFGEPRGLPADDPSLKEAFPLSYLYDLAEYEKELMDDKYASWLLREELVNFNYDASIEILIPERGSYEALKPGEGWVTTWREYIDPTSVEELLERLQGLGKEDEIRLVFDFSW